MNNFIGIDLGTTNSVIYVYDGAETVLIKSREGNDVTPSVIYYDPRGRKQIGHAAYTLWPIYPKSCAKSFKRRMGEDHLIELSAVNLTVTPEECSVDILKELFGSPELEEIRKSSETGTVITVPAAFNQKARYATRQAAEMAGIGKVELMQEPVAAVMSFMRTHNADGTFLIYDLGGGTFDVAIAQSTGGKVNLLAHGGIEVCGGEDFDRLIVDNIILPQLYEKYDLPDDLDKNKDFENFTSIFDRSAERAKIELSRSEESTITIPPTQGTLPDCLKDLKGETIFQEFPLRRDTFDKLIVEKINDTINCARKTMEECGVNAHDIDRIVWVGGPTHYKPLRDKVSSELGINGEIEISKYKPMTAVAEGASLFAESIDWSSEDYKMKPTRGQISSDELTLSFNYTARTPSDTSKIAVQVGGEVPLGFEFQIDSLDTASTSGRIPLKHGTTVDVNLTKPGENTFKVVVYDAVGEPIEQHEIVITKTTAIVEAIPSPSSISLVVHDKSIGKDILVPLIEKGDTLPKKVSVPGLKARKALEAGSSEFLNFILLEGEFKEDIYANENIGEFKIKGTDFYEGVIPESADLICNFEIKNSAEIKLKLEVPDIRGIFELCKTDHYSPDEGKRNYTLIANEIIEKGIVVRNSINEIKDVVDDPKLDQALQKLETPLSLDSDESDPDKVKEADQCITQAKELLEEVKRKNRKGICQVELNSELTFFDMYCRQHSRPSEERAFDSLVATAQRSIDNNDNDFDEHLDELRARIFEILWRQPWFIIERFKRLISTPQFFTDSARFEELALKGKQLLGSDLIRRYEELSPAEKYQTAIIDDGTIEELREIVRQMMLIPRFEDDKTTERDIVVNIFKV